ncbi:MAG: carbohydrate kinase family protein [Kineosporiaceae bacterium]
MATPTPSPSPPVVVVGGANVDVKARSTRPPVLGSSNPGTTRSSPGGVGRNVAENLARLGTPVALIAHVGDDEAGDRLLEATVAAGVDTSPVLRGSFPTGAYTAVLDHRGELVVAVSEMTGTDALGAADVREREAVIAGAAVVVVDGNLGTAAATAVLMIAAEAGVPAVVDPVSAPKAARLARALRGRPLRALTPDRGELAALTGADTATDAGLRRGVATMHAQGAELVWVRLGADGSLLSTGDGSPARFPAARGPVVDVTGAGDAMLAAFVHALLRGADPVAAVHHGHAAAGITVATADTVRSDLTPAVLADALDEYLESLA